MAKPKPRGDWTDSLFGLSKANGKRVVVKRPSFVGHCPYCGDAMMRNGPSLKRPTKDHVMAKSLGYTLEENKIICCRQCNGHKSNDTLVQWLIRLLKKNDSRAVRVKKIIDGRRRAGRAVDTLPIDGSVKVSV